MIDDNVRISIREMELHITIQPMATRSGQRVTVIEDDFNEFPKGQLLCEGRERRHVRYTLTHAAIGPYTQARPEPVRRLACSQRHLATTMRKLPLQSLAEVATSVPNSGAGPQRFEGGV